MLKSFIDAVLYPFTQLPKEMKKMADTLDELKTETEFESYRDDVKAKVEVLGAKITDLESHINTGDDQRAKDLLAEVKAAHAELNPAPPSTT